MSQFAGGGLQIGGVTYFVGNLPYRKRVQLYRMDGNSIKTVAWFRRDEDATEFLAWLQLIAKG